MQKNRGLASVLFAKPLFFVYIGNDLYRIRLFPESFPYYGQTAQWEVFLYYICNEENAEHGIYDECKRQRQVLVGCRHAEIQHHGNKDIYEDLLHRIIDRVFLLSYEI